MKMGKQQWLSSTQPTALFERGVGVLWGVNMTITDRLPGESCMRPALQLVVVGSLLCFTNKDDFSMPQVKMRYVIAVLTLRQVCFRLWTMSCVTASSEMCRAQRWDLDDSCCAGAIDGVQGQGWIMGMWQRSNLWVQAKESVCGLHLDNIETTFPRLRPQVQRKLPRKATRLQAKTLETQQQLRGILSGGVVEKFLQRKTSVCLSTSGGGRHTEVPYRAGFYGDLRKAVTRSGSFSGLISVLPQRRTCVQPLHPHFFGLPTQSDRHGWTQAANKTRIRRVTTHTGL